MSLDVDGAPFVDLPLARPAVQLERRENGELVLRAGQDLGPHPRCLGDILVQHATKSPDRCFIAQRFGGAWERVSYGEALERVRSLAQGLIDLGCSPRRPVMVVSGNSTEHALLALAAMHVGIPVAPVSTAYSLMSAGTFTRLGHVVDRLKPGAVFAQRPGPYANALESVNTGDIPRIVCEPSDDPRERTFGDLLSTTPTNAVDEAFAAVTPETVAKILFTSGSTGTPKGVINTHRMMCSNQVAYAQLLPFLGDSPPVLCDWLPWNHTFGGNFNFNLVLHHGGTLYIDNGRPAAGLLEATLANLCDTSPTLYVNVPRGFDLMLPHLESDRVLREALFRRLQVIFYAGAALSQETWRRLERLSVLARQERVLMLSAWGSTETAPASTAVHWPIERAGIIGNPLPGTEIKMVPSDDKMELRVRGPNVFPGYWNQPTLTDSAFDDEGFYRIGDAGKLADPDDPARGLVFDGRVAEDFKLSSGTWVHVGHLRLAIVDAVSPVASDAVIAGRDRSSLGVLLFPNQDACRRLIAQGGGEVPKEVGGVVAHPLVREEIRRGIADHNRRYPASSTRIDRALVLEHLPGIETGEITDKGYINQRAVLDRRQRAVRALYTEPLHPDVIAIDDDDD